VVVLAFLVFINRERDRHAEVLAQFAKDAHEREQDLLQRIQAPQAAVAQHYYEGAEFQAPPAIRTDDEPGADEDWMNARLDKDDLARLAAEEELRANPMPADVPAGFGISERESG
jgi:hypothetical protein